LQKKRNRKKGRSVIPRRALRQPNGELGGKIEKEKTDTKDRVKVYPFLPKGKNRERSGIRFIPPLFAENGESRHGRKKREKKWGDGQIATVHIDV